MAKDLELEAAVVATFDSKGADDAAKSFDRLGDSLEAVGDGADAATVGVGGLDKKLKEGAKKTFPEIEARAKKVREEVAKLGATAGEISPEKIAKLRVELVALEKDAREAGAEVGDLATEFDGLDKAKEKLKAIRVESAKLGDELTLSTKNATLQQQLFSAGAGTFGQYASAAGAVTASLVGGFQAGLKIASAAGVDLTETTDLLREAWEKVAKWINFLVGGPFKALGDAIGRAGRQIEEDLLGPIERAANMAALQDAAAATAKRMEEMGKAAAALGVVTKEQATASLAEFSKSLQTLGDPASLSRAELDKLRSTYKGLIESGASVDASTKALEQSFRLLGKTQQEENAASAKAAADSQRAREKAAADAKAAADKAEAESKARRERELADERALASALAAEKARQSGDDEVALETFRETRMAELTASRDTAAGRILAERQVAQEIETIRAASRAKSQADAVLEAQNALAREGLTEAGIASLRAAEQAKIDATNQSAAEREAAERTLAERIAALRIQALGEFRNLSTDEAAVVKSKVEQILSDESLGAEAKVNLQAQTTERVKQNLSEEARWASMTSAAKVDAGVGAAGALISAGQAAFGESKELAIAQTVINTYQSATAAYAALAGIVPVGPVLGAIAAAAAIVAGLKNVQQIKASQPAGGGAKPSAGAAAEVGGTPSFDHPGNDAAARFAGAQSARDVAGQFGSGFKRELLSGLAHTRQGATSEPFVTSNTTSISIEGSFASPPDAFVRAFSRDQRKRDAIVESRVTRGRGRSRR